MQRRLESIVANATNACIPIGDCGSILFLPDANGSNFNIGGTTCGGVSGCNLVSSNDFQGEVILPFEAEWTISLCGSDYDTVLKIGSDCCTQDIANIDDTPGCGNGLQSSLVLTGSVTLSLISPAESQRRTKYFSSLVGAVNSAHSLTHSCLPSTLSNWSSTPCSPRKTFFSSLSSIH